MASENNEIGDIVKKCKILLLDVEGTTTSISFVKDTLFPYAEANVQEFLKSQWESADVKEVVDALRKLAIEDGEKKVEGAVAIPGEDAAKEEQIEGLVKSVKWQMSADRKAGPLKQLQGLIWKRGYDSGDIKGHVYDDVPPALELWNSTEGQKVYIYSSGSVQAQKLLFNQSVAGDLLPHINGHFDTAVGGKQEAASYTAIAEKIGCKADEILFLTDIIKEGEAARAAGLQVALVSREGNAPLPAEASAYPVLHSFDQLAVSNKRKPDPQEEQVPAKVLKTDIEADVKTASEMEVTNTAPETTIASEIEAVSEAATKNSTAVETVSNDAEPEKMEVEEELLPESVTGTANITEKVEKVSEKAEVSATRIETIIEEVTNVNEAGDAPICEIKPVVEESVEKTDTNETEKMEIESTDKVEVATIAVEPKKLAQDKIDTPSPPVAEETPSAVITIQEVTNEQSVIEEAEIVDDLVPVVEEPPVVEMEELKNVGEVLDKECDEILLKVQGITNLDNMRMKPLLNSIAEETIDAENGENTNDIVESILDSEMELSEKPCDDIDISTVQELVDAKVDDVTEEIGESDANIKETPAIDSSDKAKEVVEAENAVKENVCDNKNKEEKISEKISVETDILKVNKDQISSKDAIATEVTNQESISKLDEEKVQAKVNVAETKSKALVDNQEVSAETLGNKLDAKESSLKPDDNIKSNECTGAETKAETKENSAGSAEEIKENIDGPLDNKDELKENIVKPVDIEMESTDRTVLSVDIQNKSEEVVENKSEKKGSVAEQDEKMESEDSTVKSVAVKSEIKESIPEQQNNKMVLVENKSETNESIPEQANNKLESGDNKDETKENIPEQVNNKVESEDNIGASGENKMEFEESPPQENKTEEIVAKPEAAVSESKVKETSEPIVPEGVIESKESVPRDVEMETGATEKQVNGNSNGGPVVNQNGDASKEEELSSRLSVGSGENEKEVNGANGNGSTEGKEQDDNKVETEIPDIKVKTVAPEEPRTDPIEQPVEA